MSSAELTKEITDAAKRGAEETLPVSSKDQYIQTYNAFLEWKKERGNPETCNTVLMAYFVGLLDEGKKPTSLRAYYSMIKSMISLREKIDISKYVDLTTLLKRKSNGYERVKSLVFEDFEMQRFLATADDVHWLDVKDVFEIENVYMVLVRDPKNMEDRYFTISGPCCAAVKKYIEIRHAHAVSQRFFMKYKNGRCVSQVIGKQKFSLMPRRIAEFLQLPYSERYTEHSYRRPGASMYANTGGGIHAVKNVGGWMSAKVAEGYVINSLSYKMKASNTFASLFTTESVPTTSASTESPPSITGKHDVASGAYKKRKIGATSTTLSNFSTKESVSDEVKESKQVDETGQCVFSQGYSQIADDGMTDAEFMSFDVVIKSNEMTLERSVCLQGCPKIAGDDITDTELITLAENESAQLHFSFTTCSVTINLKN